MRFSSIASCLTAVAGLVNGGPVTPCKPTKPPYFLLVGDSTVAVDGGWGDGFLSYLQDGGEGENRAKSGATTVTWKSDGRWDWLVETIGSVKDDYEPIVTIQFGHNDQKVMTLDEFRVNMVGYADDIKALGGTPIFISSLTRRTFKDGKVVQNLKEWRDEALVAAEAAGVQFVDLNMASTTYVDAIGAENAQYYNWEPSDRTHLNPAGEIVFGRMTLDLVLEVRPDLDRYFEANEALSEKIENGEFTTGEE
ncbi:SGNH hydrolase-type esterase domain-containing protein [Emericellopsis cladophorae]|uniref:SGNH hydrolase-type esterase domain-containing protein n=1 Tax=Emericellopsis cladophorae TaxID=2686198 RepID=A0A9P9Y5Z1_9HYPO|nr:SGNH hydrolase-type esterase domain-containing protein [Emericellopsis cladophorae]KAI6783955.1 SGNH hydrolase-type esterase domain-containing protein [Emericellopsis cladophorae]